MGSRHGQGMKHWIVFQGRIGSDSVVQVDARLSVENMKREGLAYAKRLSGLGGDYVSGSFTIERGNSLLRTFAVTLPVYFDFTSERIE